MTTGSRATGSLRNERTAVTAEHLELLAELITTPKENVMDDQMARDHARDHRVKNLMDDARRSLDALLRDEDARRRLARHMQEGSVEKLAEHLAEQSAHTVRVWD